MYTGSKPARAIALPSSSKYNTIHPGGGRNTYFYFFTFIYNFHDFWRIFSFAKFKTYKDENILKEILD